ncbi:MAG: hypothetical protein AB1898_26300 [Acidobacteriota bacterium]
MENDQLKVCLDKSSGLIASLESKTGSESIGIREERFGVEAVEFVLDSPSLKLQSIKEPSKEVIEVHYKNSAGDAMVTANYSLGATNHFVEKTIRIQSSRDFGWKKANVGTFSFATSNLSLVKYGHQKTVTYFGRSSRGGVFLGVEKPFDHSSLENRTVSLEYAPSLKVKANEVIESEPIYLGVYNRKPNESEQSGLPLRSESDAMVAMTSRLLGPPRHGFSPTACGWWCEMEHHSYKDAASLKSDLRSLDFVRGLGIEWISDNHPWGGETERMNALRETDGYSPGPLAAQKYEYARRIDLKMVFWPTMNNTNPFWPEQGKAFLEHKPEWLMYPTKRTIEGEMLSGKRFKNTVQGNCIANRPFRDWINRLSLDGMKTGFFPGWVMDGDFFGGGGVVTPVDCPRDDHDHLPGDSTYACERALAELIRNVRNLNPNVFVWVCRPPMDLGVFSQRNVDAVFTIDEFGEPEALPGIKSQPINMMLGDKVRRWSRVRVHHHFFPHYIDQPQVFVGPKGMGGKYGRDWPSGSIDYLMLSALSSSPNPLYYLPTKTGMPEKDKAEIRKWIGWARDNEEYLMVRRDLPDWPAAGKVDGNAHIVGDRGLVFLFNPNPEELVGRFRLNEESIGLAKGNRFEVSQSYPASKLRHEFARGEEVSWTIPPSTAVVLAVAPVSK